MLFYNNNKNKTSDNNLNNHYLYFFFFTTNLYTYNTLNNILDTREARETKNVKFEKDKANFLTALKKEY